MVKKMSLEKSFEKLEEIVKKLESGDESLEKSLKLFEQGVNISDECQKSLEDLENRVKIISNNREIRFKDID